MKKGFSCANKDVIVITIETCNKKSCTSNAEEPLPAIEQEQQVHFLDLNTEPSPAKNVPELPPPIVCPATCQPQYISPKPSPLPISPKSSSEEEEPLPPCPVYKLPIVAPRYHGTGCAIEVNILEKHADNCMFRKEDNPDRNPLEDRVGSYECVGRMTFDTCPAPGEMQGCSHARNTDSDSHRRRIMHNSRPSSRKERDHTVYFTIQSPTRVPEYVLKKPVDLIEKKGNPCCISDDCRVHIEKNKRVVAIKMQDSAIETLMDSSKSFGKHNSHKTMASNSSALPKSYLEKRQAKGVMAGTSYARDEASEQTIISISDSREKEQKRLGNYMVEKKVQNKPSRSKKCKIIEVDLVSSKDRRRLVRESSSDDVIKLRSGKRKVGEIYLD